MNDLSINRLSLLAAAIDAEHQAAYGFAGEALKHAAECGRLLLEAKALLPHGDWIPWLEANTEVVPRQSQKYMRLANHWEEIAAKNELSSHLPLNEALGLIADPKPKPQPKRRCISAAEIGEVTLIHRGWIPNFTPKGGGGPWPSDIAAFYAEHAKIGSPFEVLAWQRKAARFHWSGWQNQAPTTWHEADEEDLSDDEDLDEDLDQALADEELLIEERHAEERERRAEGERIRATLPNGTKKHCPHCGGVLP